VYKFIDAQGKVIYIGKARNLRKRVTSYFAKNQSGKTTVMLLKAADVRHIVVENESDALLLENNLVKKHQPRYNILLKDDKTFPWICIKKEPFPRVFSTRTVIRDGSLYLVRTPGTHGQTLITLIRRLYKLRTCTLSLTETNIAAGKFKVCLEYHIGNCRGPCVGYQTEKDYNESIVQIRDILKGNILMVTEYLKRKMAEYSRELRFEEAQIIKEKIDILTNYRSRSAVVSNSIRKCGCICLYTGSRRYCKLLKIVEGAVIQAFTLELRSKIDEEKESLLGFAITEIRQRYSSDSSEIIVPFKPDILLDRVRYTVPKIGEKLKLLELAERNALYYKLEQKKKLLEHTPEARTGKNLEKVKKDLHMPDLPVHIECFDNSNIMGTNPVAALPGMEEAKDYRISILKPYPGLMISAQWRR
jgi:excinuclease ABC subunit C